MQELLIAKDGTPDISYVGYSSHNFETLSSAIAAGLDVIELQNVYILRSLLMPVGPGKIAQELMIFPLDAEVDCVSSITIRPTVLYPASEQACARIRQLREVCEKNLAQARSGLITNIGMRGGKLSV